MEKFLENTSVPWVKVTDPSSGRIYYSTATHEYPQRKGPDPTPIENVLIEPQQTIGSGSVNTGSLLTNASFLSPDLTFTKGDGSTFDVDISTLTVVSASYATTASYVLTAVSASFTNTASYVNPLRQNVTIGNITSTPPLESTLNIYPSQAGGIGEGGQILLAASGGLYTSASMIDNWQNQFRVLKGTNTGGSTAGLIYVDLQSGNTQFVGAVTASAYSGLPDAWLHALRSGNQTIDGGTWASRDIIFNEVSSNNFTYNSSTGIATLKAGKTYRLTARLAWSAAGLYTLKFRIYNQTTSAFTGPTVEMIQSPNGTYNVSDNTLEHILAVGASDVDISIRTTADTNALTGEYIRGDLNTQLIIQQIA